MMIIKELDSAILIFFLLFYSEKRLVEYMEYDQLEADKNIFLSFLDI